MPDLNLRHLRAVALAARHGSLTAAAAQIGLSQPALTQGVARLEQQLTARLFERLPHGLRPTAMGEKILVRIERALRHFRESMPGGAGQHAAPPDRHLTLTQVRTLLCLVEAGSLSAAARILGVSQPAVQRPVRALEVACRTALVERRSGKTVLTSPGRRMTRGFRLGLNELVVAWQESTRRPDRVSVGAMALSRSLLLPLTLADLSREAPWARIDVMDGSSAELFAALRSGVIDVVVGALRDVPPADLKQELLLRDSITVIARSGHPLADRQSSLEELAAYPWIVGRRTSDLLERWQQIFDRAGIARPRAPIQCGSVTTIRGLLVRSDFLTLLSCDQVSAEMEAGQLTAIASGVPDTVRTIGIITRGDWFPSTMQQRFLALLRNAAASMDEQKHLAAE